MRKVELLPTRDCQARLAITVLTEREKKGRREKGKKGKERKKKIRGGDYLLEMWVQGCHSYVRPR